MTNIQFFQRATLVLLIALVAQPLWLAATNATVTNTFSNGAVADATAINQNFGDVTAAINARAGVVNYMTGVGESDVDNGMIPGRSLTFNKVSATSTLRVFYYDSFRCFQATNSSCEWEILFNGNSCTNPGKLHYSTHQNSPTSNDITATTIAGFCKAAGGVTLGTQAVTITVRNATFAGDSYTGWNNVRYSIQAQEIP